MDITIGQLYVRDVRKIECRDKFPPTALSVTMKISSIDPKDSAVLIYTPKTGENPVRFNGPESIAEVPVSGHEIYLQPILGCQQAQIDFLGWKDDI